MVATTAAAADFAGSRANSICYTLTASREKGEKNCKRSVHRTTRQHSLLVCF